MWTSRTSPTLAKPYREGELQDILAETLAGGRGH